MDPVGPWSAYASYNRLAGVQSGAASGDFHHHLATGAPGLPHNPASGVPSTTSQLLLQAAHTTASLAGQLGSSTASPFNPGTFLSPPPVAYDAMFSPLFHHGNPKPAHYNATINAQHRQAIAQAQAAVVSKQAGVESDLSTLRENYNQHHQSLAAAQGSGFFDQSSAQAASNALAWQNNNQLPSPFGILPHESVVPSSPGPPTTKVSASTAVYENFNAHFAAAQTLNNHINSQLVAANSSKIARSASPQVVAGPIKPVASQASSNQVSSASFYQNPASFGGSETLSSYTSSTGAKQDYTGNGGQAAGKNNRNPVGNVMQQPQQQQRLEPPTQEIPKIPEKKPAVPVTSSSGFMASYLKFLQGERDTSPPPASRGARKSTWTRNTSTTTNSASVSPAPIVSSIVKPSDVSSNGLKTNEDDPRYFPLPKDRKRKNFESSDDSFETSDEDGLTRGRVKPVLNVPTTDKGKKIKGNNKPLMNAGKKPIRQPVQTSNTPGSNQPPGQMQQYYQQQPEEADPLQLPPRRETSKRKAKERNNIAQLIDRQATGEGDEPEEPPEFVDSDSDPAWTPQDKADEDGMIPVTGMSRKKKRIKTLHSGRKPRRSNILSVAAQGAGINDFDFSSDEEDNSMMHQQNSQIVMQQITPAQAQAPPTNQGAVCQMQQQNIMTQQQQLMPQHQQNVIQQQQHQVMGHHQVQHHPQQASMVQQQGNKSMVNVQQSTEHYKNDEFVVARADLTQEWPILWRVDGKSLLQKFEPFQHNGTTLYRNMSTYAAWVSENRRLYVLAPVRIRSQTHHETIVEFLRNEIVLNPTEQPVAPNNQTIMPKDNEFIQRCMNSTAGFQDNFEVYIQTLISQALDSNFLTEIFQEQDEYFLSNVKTIDDLTRDRRTRLIAISRFPRNLEMSISIWPCYNIITDIVVTSGAVCIACRQPGQSRLILFGQPYNQVTLEGCQPDSNVPVEKDFLMCRNCSNRIALLNKVMHQKYLMFIECAKRVSEKRSQDSTKDTTVILNELLADENWLSQLFRDVRSTWAEVDYMEHQWRHLSQ